ncbi:glycosyltransferase [Candidatus Kaiserbacteria bacterium]|nr:glycosyltransferase [Candidatus Kaiserbacteria bacterium]
MNILIATGLYPPESGGPATNTKLLEERLPARGFSVAVLPFRAVRHWPKVVRHLVYFWKCYRMARAADVVYAQDTVSVGFPAVLAARLAGAKFVVRVPGDYAWEQAGQRFGTRERIEDFQSQRFGMRVEFLRTLQRYTVRHADRVIAPSKYLHDIVLGWGAKKEKVILIYNGIELPVPTEAPTKRPEGFLVVTAARRVPWKGIEALERVVAREKGWRVFVADILTRPQALGWIQAADVFVLNSSYEGLSHQLIEVMSLGTPIIATSVGGNPELITDGVEGLLIPPQNDEALYAALKNIEADPVAARARAEAARTKAGQFNIERTLGHVVELFKTL